MTLLEKIRERLDVCGRTKLVDHFIKRTCTDGLGYEEALRALAEAVECLEVIHRRSPVGTPENHAAGIALTEIERIAGGKHE